MKAKLLRFPKLLFIGALLLALLAGAVIEGFTKLGVTNASAPASQTSAPTASATAPSATTVPQSRASYPEPRRVHHRRSFEKEALIVGGSAAGGALIGGLAGGGKGAGIGAASGGIAGLIYDLATRNK